MRIHKLQPAPRAVRMAARRRGERGPQKKLTKALVPMRLSPDFLAALRQ